MHARKNGPEWLKALPETFHKEVHQYHMFLPNQLVEAREGSLQNLS